MNLQPTLENELVRIRPLVNSDLEPLYKVAQDPNIWKQHPCKRYLRSEFEKFFLESIESKGALTILDKSTDKIMGSSRYKKFDGFPDVVEIGWTYLGREYWGGKYNGSLKSLMVEYAFNFVSKIVFYVHKNNIRSQKAVEKIGGQKVVNPPPEQFPKTSPENLIFALIDCSGRR